MSKKRVFLKNYKLFSALPVWGSAFVVNLLIALIVIAPVMIRDGGYFSMYYDFAAEQIPYGMLMNQAIKSGDFLWNWGIDMGGNLIEAFGFYGIGSPFLWLSLLFPAKAFPKLIGWILTLKFAVAGATSAKYFERHIHDKRVTVFASILYAFSGFQITSILFYIFQDVVALFPLMLIGLEELTEDKRAGKFAIACAINALCNYVFFVGEVLFVVIFFIVKYLMSPAYVKQFKSEIIRKIGLCVLEGAVGVMISGIVLIPGVLSLMGNARVSEHIQRGEWVNRTPEYILSYLRAFIIPAENMCRTSTIDTSDLMTNSLYLPLVGIVLALAYFISRGVDWIKRMLVVCAVIALVPLFNNAFVMFTNTCYRRWYYMFILMLALASGKALEEAETSRVLAASGMTLSLIALFAAGINFFSGKGQSGNMVIIKSQSIAGILIAAASVVIVAMITLIARKNKILIMEIATGVVSIFLLAMTLISYRAEPDNARIDFRQFDASLGKAQVTYLTDFAAELDRDIFPYRYYINEDIGQTYGGPDYTYYNLGMTASLPTINSFHSTVHPSILDYYNAIGITRYTPWTRATNQGQMELLGVRYILSAREYDDYDHVNTLTNSNGQSMYLYENENALPLAFGYDSYMTLSEFEVLSNDAKQLAMLEALVVKDEDEYSVAGTLKHFAGPFHDVEEGDTNNSVLQMVLSARSTMAGEDFTKERNRFGFNISANSAQYAFVSLPYDKHWKASVNGEAVSTLNINGLTAFPIEAGDNIVEFSYHYTPIWIGLISTLCGIILLVGYWQVRRKKAKLQARSE